MPQCLLMIIDQSSIIWRLREEEHNTKRCQWLLSKHLWNYSFSWPRDYLLTSSWTPTACLYLTVQLDGEIISVLRPLNGFFRGHCLAVFLARLSTCLRLPLLMSFLLNYINKRPHHRCKFARALIIIITEWSRSHMISLDSWIGETFSSFFVHCIVVLVPHFHTFLMRQQQLEWSSLQRFSVPRIRSPDCSTSLARSQNSLKLII